MSIDHLEFHVGFRVVRTLRACQCAELVLKPGEQTGGPDNRHVGSDQWLYVVSGTGAVTIAGRQRQVEPADLVLIERGETHEVACTGQEPLRTLNFYSPPAYTSSGDELPAGRSEE